MKKSKVAVVRCGDYNETRVYEAVKKAVELVGGIGSIIKKGESVLLKPNVLAGDSPDKNVCTHPSVFGAVARIFGEMEYRVTYGDSPAFEKSQQGLTRSGLRAMAEKYHLLPGDFDKGRQVANPQGMVAKKFDIANAVLDTDALVSICKMKTHALTRITGAVKNQFGCVYGMNKAAFHVKFPNRVDFSKMLVDLNVLVRPRLFIMDGIVAMEGNGPRGGDPVNMNCIIVSTDPIAVDSTFCRMIGLNPAFVPTIVYGAKAGLGTYHSNEIEYLGEPWEKFHNNRFRVERSPVSGVSHVPGPLRNFLTDRPVIDAAKCVKCGICVGSCPVEGKALQFLDGNKSRPPVYDYKKCIRCYCCQETCPEKAITVRKPLAGLFGGRKS